MTTLNIRDFGIEPGSRQDAVLAVKEMLSSLKPGDSNVLVFPRGRYDFWPHRAAEHYLFVSNNDPGLKRIAFPLIDVNDVEVRGENAEFVFHGAISPFAIVGSESVKVSGITIDYERPFVSEVEILAATELDAGKTVVEIGIPDIYPYAVVDERLVFLGEDDEVYDIGNILEWNSSRKETELRVFDNYNIRRSHRARELRPGTVSLTAAFASVPTPGNILAIDHGGRRNPGFIIARSRNILLTDVTMHQARGMGVIAQWTENIRLERFKVVPAADKGRIISTCADATHFVNCKGVVELIDCVFEGQLDDPTNIHGIYARISRVLDSHTVEVELVHHQQYGLSFAQVGDRIDFITSETLLTSETGRVTQIERLNKQFLRVSIDEPIGRQIKPGDCITNADWVCDAVLRGNETGRNRARGFLISTPGKVLVENNHFYNPGAAILIAGDANYWFESGYVKDVTIRNNHFDRCLYGVWGRAVIDINPEMEKQYRPGSLFHSNIKIENNRFDLIDPRILSAHCVDGLVFQNNQINYDPAFDHDQLGEALDVTYCKNVDISKNTGLEYQQAGRVK